ncbi:phage portal protein [Azospirillum cavernae]|uniref:Phage portal protein n=1 Tax=Azospirillum cavernae TaxID=2320860 RepID=A0A418VXI4_9PROT|nr:phage portal protein [Azospirillum cavernae]RJF81883.1 phage portal protein [Azospirillum cavernae]
MLSNLRRAFGTLWTRSLDAAGAGKRWAGASRVVNLNADMLSGATVAAQRAAYVARNNPNVAAAINAMVSNAVGTGIKPRSKHPDDAVRDTLHALWERWERVADASGRAGGFYGQQALAVRAMIEGGESFARLRSRLPGDGLPVPFQVELIARDQVPSTQWSDIRPGNAIRGGIEFNALGQRIAYWVLPFNPNDPTMPLLAPTWQPTRVPAEDMCHLFRELVESQLRGLTWLAPVLLRVKELDQYEDAALVRAKVAAMMAGFILNKDAENPAWQPQPGAETPTLEPGMLVPLNPGESVEFTSPPDDKNYTEFTKNHLRAIAVGLGCTYFQATGDLRDANYSSLRGGLVEFRRSIEQLQHLVIVPQLCDPVWRRFVTLAVMSGAIDAPDFFRDPEPYLSAEWLPPAFDWVDPLKDIRAEIESIDAGLKSRAQSVAEAGYDVEALDAEIAADRARERRMGLAFPVPKVATPTPIPEDPPAPETPAHG